jgi:multiple sugar transport system substrate-binding protein
VGAGSLAVASALSACGGGQAPAPAASGEKPAAQAGPGGFGGGGSLKLQLSSHFVPAFDVWIDKWMADWGARNKVEITVDHILGADIPSKVAAEVAAGSGHDLIRMTRHADANLYSRNLVDVSDLAKQIGQDNGGWVLPLAEKLGVVDGVWRALPEYTTEQSSLYRKDLFDQNGFKPVETWDDLLKVGSTLKAQGNQIGIAINQKSNDALNSWQSVIWSHGGGTVAADSRTVTINSPEVKEALTFGIELYNKTMTPEVLSWDDTANNQLLASGKGSWIHNPISALRTIEKENPELAKKIWISPQPAGPKGRFTTGTTNVYGIFNWTKNASAAKALMAEYFANYAEAFKASEGYNQPVLLNFRKKPMPILGDDPKYALLQDVLEYFYTTGHPGVPTPAAGEVDANWIVPLMVARAVQDGNVDEAANWGQQKLEAIYAKYK